MKRSELRETIFRLLFMGQFEKSGEGKKEQIGDYLDEMRSGLIEVPYAKLAEEEETREESPAFVSAIDVSGEDEEYIRTKLAKITEALPEIDEQINKASRGWKTSRMPKVDLSIIRLAVYEMIHDEDVPTGVAINEAVEIAKYYGGEESATFINGILGQIARNCDQETKGE
jgi:N utilization substance protein B